jgi:uncharacterized protein (DUF2147 family)
MKRKSFYWVFYFVFQLFICSNAIASKPNPDAIIGLWKPGSGNGLVQIYKQGDSYFGKIVWLKEPNDPATGKPRTDVKNDDVKLKNRPILGLINVRNLKFIKENSWKEGNVYDPNTGNDYSCKVTLIDENTLELRGFIGISIIGRTDTWKRQAKL